MESFAKSLFAWCGFRDEPAMEAIPGYQTTFRTLMGGSGAAVAKGATVTVHATGRVRRRQVCEEDGVLLSWCTEELVEPEGGKKFWCTEDPGQSPFKYQAGVGQVITGWDQGLLGMKIGEKRELLIPACEGYGTAGFAPWGVPPNATLTFTLEVLEIVQ